LFGLSSDVWCFKMHFHKTYISTDYNNSKQHHVLYCMDEWRLKKKRFQYFMVISSSTRNAAWFGISTLHKTNNYKQQEKHLRSFNLIIINGKQMYSFSKLNYLIWLFFLWKMRMCLKRFFLTQWKKRKPQTRTCAKFVLFFFSLLLTEFQVISSEKQKNPLFNPRTGSLYAFFSHSDTITDCDRVYAK